MPLSADLDPVFEDAGKQFNVDPALIKATALGESGGNARAVSPAGAGGLMQLMPETAKGLGVADPFDPVQSIYGGAAYLAQGLDKYGDPAKALMYYHGGPDESKWGQKTAAYPAYIASFYQPSRSPSAGGGNAAKPAAIADGDSGQPYAPPPQFAQERKSAMDGIEQLAAAGQPQSPPIAAAAPPQPGMSDDDLINGFVNGTLPFMQKPQAASQAGGPAMTPDVAQLSQAGRPQLQSGGATQQQISPAYIEDAQNRAALSAALGRAVPEDVNKAATLPFVGPTTAASENEKIGISRSGAITKGGVYIGHVPLETTTVDQAGNKYPAFTPAMGSAAGAASMPQGAAPGATAPGSPASPGPFGAPPPGAVMAAPSELGPGAHEALVARAKEEQESRQKNIDAGAAAQMQQATLQNMKADAPNFYTGPFASHVQQANSILRLIDPSYNGQVAGYEDFTKNAGSLTRQAVHDTSPRAAVQEFNLIGAALPNPEISPIGLNRVMNEYMGLNDYRIAKAQAQQQHEQQHGGIGNVSGFETDWQSKVSPYAFIVARMEPADRQALFSQVASQKGGTEQLAHLGQQIQYITQSGLDKFVR